MAGGVGRAEAGEPLKLPWAARAISTTRAAQCRHPIGGAAAPGPPPTLPTRPQVWSENAKLKPYNVLEARDQTLTANIPTVSR